MLNRDFGFQDSRLAFNWDDLQQSAPTVMAIALVCSQALVLDQPKSLDSLSEEAKALLFAGRVRGVYELKGDWEAFDSSQRLLSVSVEVAEQENWLFKRVGETERTIKFLGGFIELCRAGLVMHQWQREFVLTATGFELASKIEPDAVKELLEFPQKIDHDHWNGE